VCGHVVGDKLGDVGLGELLAGGRGGADDVGAGGLGVAVVDADDGDVGDGGVGGDEALELGGGDLKALVLDEFLHERTAVLEDF
jgi:hypothetical protein